jgi:hypothetical protein
MIELQSVPEVMEKLGGTAAVAQITKRKLTAASNWNNFETFPSNTYVVMTAALAEKGYAAPPSLWGMTLAESQRESVA